MIFGRFETLRVHATFYFSFSKLYREVNIEPANIYSTESSIFKTYKFSDYITGTVTVLVQLRHEENSFERILNKLVDSSYALQNQSPRGALQKTGVFQKAIFLTSYVIPLKEFIISRVASLKFSKILITIVETF